MAGPSLQGSVNVIVTALKAASDLGITLPDEIPLQMIRLVASQHKRQPEDVAWRVKATLEAVLAGTWGPL